MSTHETQKADKELAEATGEPREKFSAEGYEIPDFEDLETSKRRLDRILE